MPTQINSPDRGVLDNPTWRIGPRLAWKSLSPTSLPLSFLSLSPIRLLFISRQLTRALTMVPSESVCVCVRGFDTQGLAGPLRSRSQRRAKREAEREVEEWLGNKGQEGEIRVKDGACLKKCHVVKPDISGRGQLSGYHTEVDCQSKDKAKVVINAVCGR